MDHSLNPCGASREETFAFSTNASLMMFTVKLLVALILRAVSFMLPFALCMETLMSGGLCVTWWGRDRSQLRLV